MMNKRKKKNLRKGLLCLVCALTLMLLCSQCGSFKKTPHAFERVYTKDIHRINGVYRLVPMQVNPGSSQLANHKFYREYGRNVRDTLQLDTTKQHSFRVKVLNKKFLRIAILEDTVVLRIKKLAYRLKNNDGFVYIKNENTKVSGIPYVFGGVDIRKVRITLDASANLVLQEYYRDAGGLLLVLGGAKTSEGIFVYERVGNENKKRVIAENKDSLDLLQKLPSRKFK